MRDIAGQLAIISRLEGCHPPSSLCAISGTVRQECKFVTLLARLDESNLSVLDFHLFPEMDRSKEFHLRKDGWWLSRGVRLENLGSLLVTLNRLLATKKPCDPRL